MDRHRAIGTILIVALSGFLMGFDGSLFTGAVASSKVEFALSDFELGWAVTSHGRGATVSIFSPVHSPIASGGARCCASRPACSRPRASLAALSREFRDTDRGAFARWPRRRRGADHRADVHRGDFAVRVARSHGVRSTSCSSCWAALTAFVSNLIHRCVSAAPRNGIGAGCWASALVPAVPYFFALLVVPESPRWLAMHNQLPAARRVLARAHGTERADRELEAMLESLEHEATRAKPALVEILNPALRGVLIIGLLVGVLQQVTGISSVLSYAVGDIRTRRRPAPMRHSCRPCSWAS